MSATKEEIVAFMALEFPQTKCVIEQSVTIARPYHTILGSMNCVPVVRSLDQY